jgi:hypothetical protein
MTTETVFEVFHVARIAASLLLVSATSGSAQSSPVDVHVSARAAVAYTRVDPVPGGSSLAETKIEQDMIMAMLGALDDHLRLTGTLNLEGLTMPGGVLTLGGWGEGFNERRHPHTYGHELMLSGTAGPMRGPFRASLAIGKGFVAFGSDDPMNRPALRFPVNHHWSQILERAVITTGLQAGPFKAEGTLFNGDEPERWDQWPRVAARFGDSWALRLTVNPLPGLEVQGSRAHVHSPEHRPGAGPDQEKWSFSGRLERSLAGSTLYAMGEWARTDEGLFRFESWLAEGSWIARRHRAYYRLERTDRPEEERTLDPFRSVRPHLENSILGVSQWTVQTLGYGYAVRLWKARLEPSAEISYAKARETRGGLFDVATFFGRDQLWSLTLGLSIQTSMPMPRMGRYGVSEAMTHHH